MTANALRIGWNCGRMHEYHQIELFPAYGKICSKCHKPNHFAAKCRGGRKLNTGRSIKAINDRADEVFQTRESGNHLCFHVDTGAQCNVIPLALYKKATNDFMLEYVTHAKPQITAYGAVTLPVVHTVLICVWCGDFRCRLDCKLVDCANVHPLLGRKACVGMHIWTVMH